jgi:DNA-directed RNA polymerase subunit omega
MARITVEDCLEHVENRFDLVLKASKRARKLITGAQESDLPWENDKAVVLALREIAAGYTFNTEGERISDEDSYNEDII